MLGQTALLGLVRGRRRRIDQTRSGLLLGVVPLRLLRVERVEALNPLCVERPVAPGAERERLNTPGIGPEGCRWRLLNIELDPGLLGTLREYKRLRSGVGDCISCPEREGVVQAPRLLEQASRLLRVIGPLRDSLGVQGVVPREEVVSDVAETASADFTACLRSIRYLNACRTRTSLYGAAFVFITIGVQEPPGLMMTFLPAPRITGTCAAGIEQMQSTWPATRAFTRATGSGRPTMSSASR